MEYLGNLLKMNSFFSNPIEYTLVLGEHKIFMNELIDKTISLKFLNKINCIRCGRETTKSFAQGFCFPCFRTAPETEECVLRPELCLAHEGSARDMVYAKTHCLIDHYVYLAFTSGIKVGVTRHTQIPTRWIDQGATLAVKLAKTPNRYLAGCIEVAMKAHFNDKTSWQKMLYAAATPENIMEIRAEALQKLPAEYSKFVVNETDPVPLNYPVLSVPDKLRSISLDKQAEIRDKMVAIKGQYLVFESGKVINIRKHNGYLIKMNF